MKVVGMDVTDCGCLSRFLSRIRVRMGRGFGRLPPRYQHLLLAALLAFGAVWSASLLVGGLGTGIGAGRADPEEHTPVYFDSLLIQPLNINIHETTH